jgi:uncharacterized protein DUF5309
MPGTQTVPAGLMSTFDVGSFGYSNAASAIINHEDLMDIVTILDSYQTPMFSSMPKIRARDVVHSWTVDTLAATSTAGVVEGADFSADTMTNSRRLINVTQIFSRHVMVADRERDANPAGIRDMYEHQIMKEFKVIARNLEARIWAVNSTGSATGAEAATNAPLMASIRGFDIITAASASGGVTTADIVTLSESLFNAGAEPDSIWFAPASKRQFVNATVSSGSGNVRNIAATDQKLVANVDVFETPFNQLYAVITDRFIPISTSSAVGAYYIGDRSMCKLAVFRPPQHKAMGKGGDHTRGIVLIEATLQVDHPSSWAAMTGVTNG